MIERSCGTCYACCVYLDIKELRKPGNRPCKHLCGPKVSEKRCGIYDKRPKACSSFLCSWRVGLFDDDMRPDQCGLLVVMYDDPEHSGGILVTINITDDKKCGTVDEQGSPLSKAVHQIVGAPLEFSGHLVRVTVVNRRTGRILEFSNGEVWSGKLRKGVKLEELSFRRERMIASYMTAEKVSDIPLELRQRGLVIK